MKFEACNIHKRDLNSNLQDYHSLIDSFAETSSNLWPHKLWPRDDFNEPLRIGTIGGHGGTQYKVEVYIPGHFIRFRFISPPGFEGFHQFKIKKINEQKIELSHTTRLRLSLYHWVMWQLAIRWVHDALIEDAFDSSELFLIAKIEHLNKWKWRVYILRYLLGVGRLVKNYIKNSVVQFMSIRR